MLRSLARAFWTAAEAHGSRAGRRRQIEALQAKSDADLAEMGIARDRIAHHVFKDLYYYLTGTPVGRERGSPPGGPFPLQGPDLRPGCPSARRNGSCP
jgi:hypothetical protein